MTRKNTKRTIVMNVAGTIAVIETVGSAALGMIATTAGDEKAKVKVEDETTRFFTRVERFGGDVVFFPAGRFRVCRLGRQVAERDASRIVR